MASSRIEELIEDIYEFVESCKMQPLSSTKVVVPKDDLYDLLDELRLSTPDEVKKFQKIIANRDAILNDAEAKANQMIREAENQVQQMISEHEITKDAYARADSIISQATAEAAQIRAEANDEASQVRKAAMGYTGDMLNNLESILATAVNDTQNYYENLLDALQSNHQTVVSNRNELYGNPSYDADPVNDIMNSETDASASLDDFHDTDFMSHID
ncbi:MAG: ATPase [Lachnospiraceae bacterium]|nr:ATPase [Lachnospiraceae bacterium]MBQ9563081.1 ATPase [Lachnospiraceae bacterium]MBQ9593815.1 ATPase [Lachnospiraceae bacterium]MBR0153003.1 ATPase [Lachnospiraceae bacterium]